MHNGLVRPNIPLRPQSSALVSGAETSSLHAGGEATQLLEEVEDERPANDINDSGQIVSGAVPAAIMALLADEGLGWVERKFSRPR